MKFLDDVRTVVLGGINKTTNKPNPRELTGYYLRSEQRSNKFNPGKPQNYYIFQTKEGEVGVYGKAGIDREMRKATIGALTTLVNTEEKLDVGKGNPMTVYRVAQDASDTIEVDGYSSSEEEVDRTALIAAQLSSRDEEPEADEKLEEALPPASRRPAAATEVTTSHAAKVKELLSRTRTSSKVA